MSEARTHQELLAELEQWRIRAARGTGKARLSLQDIASASGVPRSSLSSYLSGATLMPGDALHAVVLALGATTAQARQWVTEWEQATAARATKTAPKTPGPPAAPTSPVPHQLPSDAPAFTGREPYLAELDKLLDNGDGAAVVISAIAGTAGVGKTALAVHWAHRVAERFPDGQLFVDLQGFSPVSLPLEPAVAVREFLDALGVEPGRTPVDLHSQVGMYRSLIAGRKMLIVLDNAANAEQVMPLLPDSPTCIVIVTSRSRLDGLETAHDAHPLDLDALPSADAHDLLANCLGSERLENESEAVSEMLAVCGGLPLAVRIVAARAEHHPDFPFAVFAEELRDTAARMDALDAGDPHSNLPVVLSWSARALSAQVTTLFLLLGIAPGPDISLPAAASLAGWPAAQARAALDELERAFLVQQHTPGRYRMHDLIRLYAIDTAHRHLAEDTQQAALRRVLDFYIRTAHTADRLLYPHRQPIQLGPPASGVQPLQLADIPTALAWLDTEHPALVAAQLVLAPYRSGRQADALVHYEQPRMRLTEELGLGPGPTLQQLHQRILNVDGSLVAPGPQASPAAVGRPVLDAQLDRAARELATVVTRQWSAEAEIRSLHRPAPLRLRWSTTGRPVTAAGDVLSGDISDVATRFRELPVRQLVVLGEPGAGKTVLAILLTLGLLADRDPGDPAPVLLPLSSWNPHQEHLHRWLARRLLEEYPGLRNTRAYGRDASTRLVTDGRVIPVLDGLDELPPALHAAALDALDQAIAGGRPLVVTCRGEEYEKAVQHGSILTSAAVVEIEPVQLDDAIGFLTARHRVGDTRWQPVVDQLRHHRDGPLAQVLSTPLMVDLARTVYNAPASDPSDLLDRRRFPDRVAIEDHLLDAFLPATYADRPQPPDTVVRAYGQDQARQWLTFLAHHLRHTQTSDFAWWQLVRAVPRPVRGIVLSMPAACLFALAGLLARDNAMAMVYGLSTAIGGCAAQGWGNRSGPLRVEVRFRGTAWPFLGRFTTGLAIGAAIGLVWSLPVYTVVILAAVLGFSMGLHVWLKAPTSVTRASSPAATLAQDRVATQAFAASMALSIGLFYAFAIALSQPHSNLGMVRDPFHVVRALPAGLVSALLGWLSFRLVGAVSYGLAGFVIGGLAMSHHITLDRGLAAGAVFGLAIGVTTALSRPWGAYLLCRTWLALRGQLPFRLNTFLADAHRRGVLRQAGAVYQFRHARLRDRLTKAC